MDDDKKYKGARRARRDNARNSMADIQIRKANKMVDMPAIKEPVYKIQMADLEGKQIEVSEENYSENGNTSHNSRMKAQNIEKRQIKAEISEKTDFQKEKMEDNMTDEQPSPNLIQTQNGCQNGVLMARTNRQNGGSIRKPHLNIIRVKQMMNDLEEEFENEHNKISKEKLYAPMIELTFEGIKTDALVDTGAQISAITKTLYDDLVQSGEPMQIMPIRKFILRGAFSERGSVIANKARLTFEYAGKRYEHEFNIVEKMAYNMNA